MFLEINENGLIEREIGFNINGGIIHAYPSDKYHFGKYGIFDLTPFKYKKLNSDLDLEDFEKIWNKT